MLDLLLKCATDLDFDALRGELDKLKSEALGLLASSMADAKAALQAQMDAFETTIRGWIPELPDLPVSPGDPMLPELLALAASAAALTSIVEPVTKAAAQKAYDLAYAAFKEKYADAIAKAGSQIDALIEGLNGGIDPCSLVPNILTMLDGTVTEVPKIPLYAKTDPVAETPSEIAAPMIAQVKKISADLSATESEMKSMTSAYEGVQTAILGEISSFKDSMNKESIDRSEYYKTLITKLEESSTSVESTSVPSVAKLALDNIRQGTSLT
jgi:hypothetical protein